MFEDREKDDGDPPYRLIERILEAAIVIAVSGWLVRLGIRFFLEVWPVVAILVALGILSVIGWRIWRHYRQNRM